VRGCYVESKSRRSARTLSLPDAVIAALKVQRVQQLEEQVLAGDRWRDRGLVFTSTVGTPLEPSNLNKWLHGLLEECGLEGKGMHSLRHYFASLSIGQGVHPRVVMEMLGHAQISLTMDTYSHVMPTMLKDAAKALGAALAVGE
jgi:integrase